MEFELKIWVEFGFLKVLTLRGKIVEWLMLTGGVRIKNLNPNWVLNEARYLANLLIARSNESSKG